MRRLLDDVIAAVFFSHHEGRRVFSVPGVRAGGYVVDPATEHLLKAAIVRQVIAVFASVFLLPDLIDRCGPEYADYRPWISWTVSLALCDAFRVSNERIVAGCPRNEVERPMNAVLAKVAHTTPRFVIYVAVAVYAMFTVGFFVGAAFRAGPSDMSRRDNIVGLIIFGFGFLMSCRLLCAPSRK